MWHLIQIPRGIQNNNKNQLPKQFPAGWLAVNTLIDQ